MPFNILESSKKNNCILRMIGNTSPYFSSQEAAEVSKELQDKLQEGEFELSLIPATIEALKQLELRLGKEGEQKKASSKSSKSSSENSLLSRWAKETLQRFEDFLVPLTIGASDGFSLFLFAYLFSPKPIDLNSSYGKWYRCGENCPLCIYHWWSLSGFLSSDSLFQSTNQLTYQLFKISPSRLSPRLLTCIETLVATNGESQGKLLSFPPSLRGQGMITLGKICLQEEDYAKKYMATLAHEASNSPFPIIRNNSMLILSDLCIRWASFFLFPSFFFSSSLSPSLSLFLGN